MDEQILPVTKTAEVPLEPSDAFELFTSHISLWWPLEKYSIRGEDAETCIFELWVGGDIFELAKGSERLPWGKVLEFNPPNELVATWHPGRDESTAQRLQVSFNPREEGGTEVHLMHDNWESLGDRAREVRDQYESGWDEVLHPYLELAREEAARKGRIRPRPGFPTPAG